MNTNRTSTQAAPAGSTHQIVAHPLAVDTTRGYAALVLAATIAAGAVAGAVTVHPVLLAGLVVASIPAVYGAALLSNLKAERRRFYEREIRDQVDYDKDGVIGDPVGHIVNAGRPDEFTLPTLAIQAPAPARPLVAFPVPANDVVFILRAAKDRGLGFRAWVGTTLPSGTKLTPDVWRAVQDGLLRWQFATKHMTATGRRVELNVYESVEEMIGRVKKGAE